MVFSPEKYCNDKYYYDEKSANRVIEWIEKFCKHTEGELYGQSFILADWQKDDIIKPVFGLKNKITGKRKIRRIYIEIPKKNGKTTLGAALALYMISADGEPGAEAYGAAADKFQASIMFKTAKTMIELSPALEKRFTSYTNSITYDNGRGRCFYQVLSREGKTKHGFNAHSVLFDELHTQPDTNLYDTLKGAGAARSQPLFWMFTTSGDKQESICWEMHEYTKKVNSGIIEDESFHGVIYTVDKDEPIDDPKTWAIANPNYPISPTHEFLRQESNEVKNRPSYENSFRRLHLNQWVSTYNAWVSDTIWQQNTHGISLEDLKEMPCIASLDLASISDITALNLLFNIDEKKVLLSFFWVPESAVIERVSKGHHFYSAWVKSGHLKVTEGNVTDYDAIRNDLNALREQYEIRLVGYDDWNSSQLIINLTNDGFECQKVSQAISNISPASKQFERDLKSKNIEHFNNPVLRWMMNNVHIYMDPNGNIKPVKNKSLDKIDGIIAAIMGYSEYMKDEASISYDFKIRSL